MAINTAELDALVDDIVDEMVGLGPLEPLLKDPDINDILINGHQNCFVEKKGKLQQVHIPFKDEAHLLRIINKIVAAVGRRVDESQPMVDARMIWPVRSALPSAPKSLPPRSVPCAARSAAASVSAAPMAARSTRCWPRRMPHSTPPSGLAEIASSAAQEWARPNRIGRPCAQRKPRGDYSAAPR